MKRSESSRPTSPLAAAAVLVAVTCASPLSARTVGFDFDDGQTDVEFAEGITTVGDYDLAARGRVEVEAGIWLEVTATDADGNPATGHVNDAGLGVVGGAGANQLSAGESLTLRFFDAEAGGQPASVELDRIALGNFGGTAPSGTQDALTLTAGSLDPIAIDANTSTFGTGWTYTQFEAGAAQGRGELTFSPPVSLDQLVLTDSSSGVGGSRLQRIAFNEPTAPPRPDPHPDAPNVVFIIADDMGYSDLGCYGGEIDTPELDRLADEGIRFRQFYNNAKCETTRSALMSGLYHGRCGLRVERGASLAEAMRRGGYRTYASGKWHLCDPAGGDGLTPVDRGFDRFYGLYTGASNYFAGQIDPHRVFLDTAEPGAFVSPHDASHFTLDSPTRSRQTSFPAGYYMTDAIADHACAFIEDSVTHHPDRPFFLYLAFNAPHTPLQAPVPLIDKYRDTYEPKGWDVLREEKWQRQLELGIVEEKWQLSRLREDIPRWSDLTADEKDIEDHRRAVYAAMVDSMDQNIGKVLTRLDSLGRRDDTLVIFCSDNGAQAFDNATPNQRLANPDDPGSRWDPGAAWAAYGNTPFRYYKQAQHQGGICAPLIARWPGVIDPGTLTDQPGHVVDVMATLVDVGHADYASLTTPEGAPAPPLDGASLRPILEGGTRPGPDFWGFEFNNSDFAVIQDDWKLVSFRSGPWRLFHLADDRTETHNLVREHPDKASALAALYDQWAADTYGNDGRTFPNRRTPEQLGTQHMRYEQPRSGALYRQPPVGVTVSAIGGSAPATVTELHEIWTLEAAGTGIGGTRDDFALLHRPFLGDGELVVRVEAIAGAAAGGRAGIMLRGSTAAESPFAALVLTPDGQARLLHRATAGAAVVPGPSTAQTAPAFLRLQRSGDTLHASTSADGLAWSSLGEIELALGNELLAGIAAASGSATNAAAFTLREWEQDDLAAYPGRFREIDGLPALLAYALGAGPATPARDRLPRLTLHPAEHPPRPLLTFTRRNDLSGLSLSIQASTDLAGWSGDDAVWTLSTETPGPSTTETTLQRQRTDPNPEFFRLAAFLE